MKQIHIEEGLPAVKSKTNWKIIGFIVGGVIILIFLYIISYKSINSMYNYSETNYNAYRRSHILSNGSYKPRKYS